MRKTFSSLAGICVFLAGLAGPTSAYGQSSHQSPSLSRFLKACAWGTAIGAAVGTVTLAFEDRPSDHTVNIARGASLGLYGGIAAGLLQMNPPDPAPREDMHWGLAPTWTPQGAVDGIQAFGLISRF